MESHLILVITLLLTLVFLTMVSEKLGISTPIFLVMAGLGLSLLPGLPPLRVKHDLIFFILLPPLLYRSAWDTHWHEFWANRLSISLHGIGLVVVTAVSIGFLAHWIVPGLSLAQGILLGSIVAPPDALAASSILQRLTIPARTVTVLEGESLINDATSLILFRFALIAVLSGQFSFAEAGEDFVIDSVLGIGIGCGIGGLVYLIHRFAPTTSNLDTLLSLATPYLMYLIAEQVHASGVLVVVSGGLLLSYYSPRLFPSLARLQMLGVWETLTFLLNGLAFILVGFQLPLIVRTLHPEGFSFHFAIGFGLFISLMLMVIRLVWMVSVTHLVHWLRPHARTRATDPDWRLMLLTSWCGMRGVVTLASALSLPPRLLDHTHFPFLSLLIFTSFSVIIFTLVAQGLTLPFLISGLNITEPDREGKLYDALSVQLANQVLDHIQHRYAKEASTLAPFIRQREKYEAIVNQLSAPGRVGAGEALPVEQQYGQLRQELITLQRHELVQLRSRNAFSDQLIRRKEHELDLEQVVIDQRLRSLSDSYD